MGKKKKKKKLLGTILCFHTILKVISKLETQRCQKYCFSCSMINDYRIICGGFRIYPDIYIFLTKASTFSVKFGIIYQ